MDPKDSMAHEGLPGGWLGRPLPWWLIETMVFMMVGRPKITARASSATHVIRSARMPRSMELERIDHVGIAVDIEAAEQAQRVLEDVLGAEPPREEVVEEQGVRTLIYEIGDAKVELLIPVEDEGPIPTFLERRGPGLHHLAFEVDDVEEAIEEVEQAGLEVIDDEPRPGVEESEIAFVHPKATFGTLLELVELPIDWPVGE